MNLPNRLTVGRLGLTVLVVVSSERGFPIPLYGGIGSAYSCWRLLTDYLDGEIARRYALITNFGKLMDPLVDKIMTAAAFVCLVPFRRRFRRGWPSSSSYARIPHHGAAVAGGIEGAAFSRLTLSASTKHLGKLPP